MFRLYYIYKYLIRTIQLMALNDYLATVLQKINANKFST